jgi:hypothetical protein
MTLSASRYWEISQLCEEIKHLPSVKYMRARDREAWRWVYDLLIHQAFGAPYDLLTCRLGANPANPNARPSMQLAELVAIVAQRNPGFGDKPEDARRVFDAIRNWRARRRRWSVSTI